jgi:hypothetical protein
MHTSIFQTLIVLSHEPVYNTPRFVATHVTGPVCPRKVYPISRVYYKLGLLGTASKLTRLASPPLSTVKIRGRLLVLDGSRTKERIFEGRVSGLPFLFEHFRRRFARVSRDAVVWKKCSGSLETLIVIVDRK